MQGGAAPINGNVVYDPKIKEFFFSNPNENEVEAYSGVDGHRVGAVTVPGPLGLSLSPDGTELAVGTNTPHFYFVDPAALHVTGVVEVPAATINPQTAYAPVQPFLMAQGPMLVAMAGSSAFPSPGIGTLMAYDRTNGTFTTADPTGAQAGIYSGMPARSLDGQYLAVPTLEKVGLQVALYSAASQQYVGLTPVISSIGGLAVNPDGSQFAVADGANITFWTRGMQQQAQYANSNHSLVYSRDGKYLFVRESRDVLALNAQTGMVAGYQGMTIAAATGLLSDTDDNNRVVGTAGLGAFVLSVAQMQTTAPLMPDFSQNSMGSSIGNPNEGPLAGGTKVQFVPGSTGAGSADGMSSSVQAYFGSTAATADDVSTNSSTSDGRNALTATAPAATANGPVTVLLTDQNNNAVFLPGAFSYGPHVELMNPSASAPGGATIGALWADGLVPLAPIPTVTFAGAPAQVFPFTTASWQGVQVNSPAGTPGWADLKVSLQDGTSETVKNGVQYLAHDVTLTGVAYSSTVFDATRNRFYLAGTDNTVAVFDAGTQTLQTPLQSSAITSGASLGSLALTPDNSRLLVSDLTDHSVVVFDLASGTSTSVSLALPTGAAVTWTGAMPIVATKCNRAFVILSTTGYNVVREVDLGTMTVTERSDVKTAGSFFGAPMTAASSADGGVAVMGSVQGTQGPWFVWKYDADSDTFSDPVTAANAAEVHVASNGDGTILAMGALTFNGNLVAQVPYQWLGVRNALTSSGALRFTGAQQVNISDTRNGRSVLNLPSLGDWTSALAVDPAGRKILACAGKTLSYFELSVVPLAVGTVAPNEASAGTTVTIHGDGFVAGTAVTMNGQNAACTLAIDQSLECVVPQLNAGAAQMTLKNPDGQTYSFENAIVVK
jgi:hypothetical protein